MTTKPDDEHDDQGHPLDDQPRRKFLKGAAAAAAAGGVAAAGLLNASTAAAATGRIAPNPILPPIGAEIPCSCLAINTPLQIRTSLVTVDFRGGIKVRVDVNPNDPINSVRLRVVGHKVSAELPSTHSSQGGGSITIEQNDVDVDAKSLLRLTQQFPPRFEQTMVLSFTMVIDQPQEMLRMAGIRSSKAYEPLILTTKNPAQLVGQLTQFPPRGDLYQLQNPVDLIDLENPDVTVATIQKFPVKVGGL